MSNRPEDCNKCKVENPVSQPCEHCPVFIDAVAVEQLNKKRVLRKEYSPRVVLGDPDAPHRKQKRQLAQSVIRTLQRDTPRKNSP